jgi:ABC-type Fe3+/spermidine/putrescine transport system ATPase subunit
MPDAYVELLRLSKRFGAVEAVRDVTLSVAEGQFLTLLGPSGCGKTTLLRLVAGFVQPDAGEIHIRGRRVNEIPPQRRSTVVVFQDYALFPHLTVFDNVAYGLRRRGLRGAELSRRVRQMLDFLGLAEQERLSPLQLSGGQQQRVALARALVVEPDVLLLDEPLSNLDAKLRLRVRTELKEIQRALNKTTILVTHDQEEALSISDRIAVMERGSIRQIGTPLEVYARPVDTFVADFVGIANLVPARVVSAKPGDSILDSPLGSLTTTQASGLAVGQSITVLLRPMALRLAAEPAPGAVQAKIRSVSFLGEFRRYHLELGGLFLIADQPPQDWRDVPAEPWLSIDQGIGFHVLTGPG